MLVWHPIVSCMLINNTPTVLLLEITCFLQPKASAQDTLILIPDVMQLLLLSHVTNGFFGRLLKADTDGSGRAQYRELGSESMICCQMVSVSYNTNSVTLQLSGSQ